MLRVSVKLHQGEQTKKYRMSLKSKRAYFHQPSYFISVQYPVCGNQAVYGVNHTKAGNIRMTFKIRNKKMWHRTYVLYSPKKVHFVQLPMAIPNYRIRLFICSQQKGKNLWKSELVNTWWTVDKEIHIHTETRVTNLIADGHSIAKQELQLPPNLCITQPVMWKTVFPIRAYLPEKPKKTWIPYWKSVFVYQRTSDIRTWNRCIINCCCDFCVVSVNNINISFGVLQLQSHFHSFGHNFN